MWLFCCLGPFCSICHVFTPTRVGTTNTLDPGSWQGHAKQNAVLLCQVGWSAPTAIWLHYAVPMFAGVRPGTQHGKF
jgi:hypothetical protein